MIFGNNRTDKQKNASPSDLQEPSLEDIGVLSFGKRKLALGLTWTSYDPEMTVRQKLDEATEITLKDPTQPSIEFHLHTDPKKTGFIGMASSDLGHEAGMKCLITMLDAEKTGPRWLGVFKISEGDDVWWIGSIRDGKIYEDQILRSRSDAEQALMSDIDAPDWTCIFAPDEWGIPDTNPSALVDLINWKSGAKLFSINHKRNMIIRGILAAIVLGVGIGGYSYISHVKEKQFQEFLEARRLAEQAITVTKDDYPWYKVVDIETFISQCADEIGKSIYLVAGWETQPISCTLRSDKGNIATGWTLQQHGNFSWIRSAIPADEDAPTLNTRGDRAEWHKSFAFDTSSIDAKLEDAWSSKQIELRLGERFHTLGIPLAIRESGSNIPRATNKVIFNSHEARLSGTYDPKIFGDILKDVPAITPESLIYNVQTGTWDLAFRIYHPPLFPPAAK